MKTYFIRLLHGEPEVDLECRASCVADAIYAFQYTLSNWHYTMVDGNTIYTQTPGGFVIGAYRVYEK